MRQVADVHSLFLCSIEVNIIYAYAGADDQLQILHLRDDILRDLRQRNEQYVSITSASENRLIRFLTNHAILSTRGLNQFFLNPSIGVPRGYLQYFHLILRIGRCRRWDQF